MVPVTFGDPSTISPLKSILLPLISVDIPTDFDSGSFSKSSEDIYLKF